MARDVKPNVGAARGGSRRGGPRAGGAGDARGGRRVSARGLAASLLVRLEREPATRASELLQGALGQLGDVRDRALATELVYGVLRWRWRLDHALERHLARGVAGLEPMGRALMRVGAHQLLVLDRIPKEIAVSATQDAARAFGLGRLTGILNAVLRKVAASGEVSPGGDDDLAIAVRASLPRWIVAALREAFPDAVEREALALRERPRVSLRPTLARGGAEAALAALAAEGLETQAVASGLIEVVAGDPFATRAAAEGLFVAQDGSGLVVVDEVAAACGGALAGKRVLDLCAGRGVKATALADRGARVVAVDVSRDKLDELLRVAARLGVHERIEATLALDVASEEAATALASLGSFDAVLVDAPCSGLGTLRRHPEIAWRAAPEDVSALAALQARLVAAGAGRVAPGGGLVYAVCTFIGKEGAVSLPSPFEAVARIDLAPSSGLDAFQVRRWIRSV